MSEKKNNNVQQRDEIVLDLSKIFRINEKHYIPLSNIFSALIIGASIVIASNNINIQTISSNSTNTATPTTNSVESENSGLSSQQKIDLVVSQMNLSSSEINNCVANDESIKNLINEHRTLGSEIGIQGTPGFVVGKVVNNDKVEGLFIPGAFPYSTFESVLNAYLSGDQNKIKEEESNIKKLIQIPESETLIKTATIGNSGMKGSKDANVAIIEYLDMNCGFCKRHYQQTFPLIDQNFISNNKIRYYKKQFPIFGEDSESIARAAECIRKQQGDAKFFEAMGLFLNN